MNCPICGRPPGEPVHERCRTATLQADEIMRDALKFFGDHPVASLLLVGAGMAVGAALSSRTPLLDRLARRGHVQVRYLHECDDCGEPFYVDRADLQHARCESCRAARPAN